MNANELAEIIEHLENARYIGASKAATMLRQQQAEIEALKAEASPYKSITNTKIEPTVVSYTHPVKELDEQFKKGFEAGKEEGWKAHKFHHPVKEQLTDEEINWLAKAYSTMEGELNAPAFARAIIRKAQEK